MTLVGAGLRFTGLSRESFWYDEVVTARLLREPFGRLVLDRVAESESTPPLYYAVAWAWVRVFGDGEVALRSLSAVVGTATVVVLFLVGRRLAGRVGGLSVGLLAATHPMLVWHSQDARAYALMGLFAALSLLFLVRVLERPELGALLAFGLAAAAAVATHYFAVFLVVLELAILAWRLRDRRVALAVAPVVLVGLLHLPLAYEQHASGRTQFIGRIPLLDRLDDAAADFVAGRPAFTGSWALALAVTIALVVVVLRSPRRRRQPALLMLALAAGTIALPVVVAHGPGSVDYVYARNLLPALLPLLVAAGVALATPRLFVVAGLAAAAGTAATVVLVASPSLHRPDWRGIAEKIGASADTVVAVYPGDHALALRWYEPDLEPLAGETRASELVFVGNVNEFGAYADPTGFALDPPEGFRLVERRTEQQFLVARFRAAAPISIDAAAVEELAGPRPWLEALTAGR